jgi:hypothetical protein
VQDRSIKLLQPSLGGGQRMGSLRQQRGDHAVHERGQRCGIGRDLVQQAQRVRLVTRKDLARLEHAARRAGTHARVEHHAAHRGGETDRVHRISKPRLGTANRHVAGDHQTASTGERGSLNLRDRDRRKRAKPSHASGETLQERGEQRLRGIGIISQKAKVEACAECGSQRAHADHAHAVARRRLVQRVEARGGRARLQMQDAGLETVEHRRAHRVAAVWIGKRDGGETIEWAIVDLERHGPKRMMLGPHRPTPGVPGTSPAAQITGVPCSNPSTVTLPARMAKLRPRESGSPSHEAISSLEKWPCEKSATDPAIGASLVSTRRARAPT